MPLLNSSAEYSRLAYEVWGRSRNIRVDSIARFARRFVRPCPFQMIGICFGRLKRTTLHSLVKRLGSSELKSTLRHLPISGHVFFVTIRAR